MRSLRSIVAVAMLSLSLPVFATPTPTTSSYDFNNAATSGAPITTFGDTASYSGLYNGTYFGNSATYAGSNGGTTTVTAWASTGMATANSASSALAPTGTGSGVNNVGQTSANGTIQNGVLTAYYNAATGGTGPYSGAGYALAETSRNTGSNSGNNYEFTCPSGNSCTTNAPNHAVDNQGAYETLLFSFSSAVTLSSVTLGYPTVDNGSTNNDGSSDMTILYCKTTSALCATSNFAGQTFSQLVSSGNWGYTDLFNLSASNDTGSTGLNIKSSMWMVGAYIADLPGQSGDDGQPDYVKIRSLTVCTSTVCSVPEPSSVALFGIAASALWVGRRRRQLRVA